MRLADDRYHLGEKLGSGGVATVLRATDTYLGVERAVKIVTVPGGAIGVELRARLQAEARAMAQLDHPNILRVHDVGSDGVRDWVVMDLAPGGSLQERLDVAGPLPAPVACSYTLAVLAALEAAHAAGIVHRDVKPGNVLLDADGTARLADFGIARIHLEGAEMTRTGAAMGSIPFMAPEQRIDPRTVTPSADLYAVATTFYALLTAGNPIDLYLAPGSSPRWEGVPGPLAEVIRRGTRAHPDDRFEDAREMRRALVRAMHRMGLSPDATVDATPVPAQPAADPDDENAALRRRNNALWMALSVSAVLMVTVASFPLWRPDPSALRPPPQAAPASPEADLADVRGTWEGRWDGHPGASLELEGTPPSLTGTLEARLEGGNAMRLLLHGDFDAGTGALVLEDDNGVFRGTVDANRVLSGEFAGPRIATAVRFVFVHQEE